LAAGELALGDRVLLAARDRTLETRGVLVVEVRLHLLAADRARLREGLGLEVVGAEAAERVDRTDEEGRAERGERLRAGLERLASAVDQRLQRRRVRDLGLARALHDHRLHVLAAEHGAEPAPARHTFAVLPVV